MQRAVLLQTNGLKGSGPTWFYRTICTNYFCTEQHASQNHGGKLLSFCKHTNYIVKRSSGNIYNELLTPLLYFLLRYLRNSTKAPEPSFWIMKNPAGLSIWTHGDYTGLEWYSSASWGPEGVKPRKLYSYFWTNFVICKMKMVKSVFYKDEENDTHKSNAGAVLWESRKALPKR